jgi:Ala-tRNA(Pro) deacylase
MKLLDRILRRSSGDPHPPIEAYLREQHVPYEVHHHPPAYAAQRVAALEHVPGKMFAKVVIAFAGEQMVMLVLPAPARVNLLKLAEVMCTENVRLAREEEFAEAFPDCEVGAMPPLGNIYHLPVFVDKTLAEDDRIVFQAGTHTESIEMSYRDFANMVHPRVADFANAWWGR